MVEKDKEQIIEDLLDLLEDVVYQHFAQLDHGEFDDNALSTNEEISEALVQYRPHRWELTSRGMRRLES